MALHASDLVTLAVAKTYINSAAADDVLVQGIITAASQAANKYCGRLLKARDLVEVYDGDNERQLFVEQYPINSITSIHQDSTRVFAPASLVTASYYLIDKDTRTIWGVSVVWINGLQTIQVTYNAGYNMPTSGYQTYSRTVDPTTSANQAYTFKLTIDGTVSDGDLSTGVIAANENFANIVIAIATAIAADANIAGLAIVEIDSDHKIRVTSVKTGLGSTVLIAEPGAGTSLTTILTAIEAVVAGVDATQQVPDDLALAILIIIESWYKSFSDHRFGVSSVSIADKTISYEKGIPKQAKDLLSVYRNRIIN